MTLGLTARVVFQIVVPDAAAHAMRLTAALGLVVAASLELVAGLLAVVLIGSMLRRARVSARHAPSVSVRWLLATAFGSFMIALAANWVGSLQAAFRLERQIPYRSDEIVVLFGLVGFLVAVSLAMSARLFPLYIQTQRPREGWLRLCAPLLSLGLFIQASGILAQSSTLTGAGQLLEAAAVVTGTVALRIFEPRRQLPRRRVRVFTHPLQLHLVTAYLWLMIAGTLLTLAGLRDIGVGAPAIAPDAVRHALGAGFVTILIIGVGSELLPGLSQSRLRWPRLRWLTLVLANLAALIRVGFVLDHHLSNTKTNAVLGLAGFLAVLAVAIFYVTLPLDPPVKMGSETG
jgi:uncharacterized protein involved in response to NO